MNTSIPQPRPSFPGWSSVAVWWSAFLSPTALFLLLLFANTFQIPSLPATLVWSLLFIVPAVALLVCESVAWSCSKTVGRRIGWMLVTLLAMLLQLAIILVILRAILVTRIAYAQ
jgi:hypothetical protein